MKRLCLTSLLLSLILCGCSRGAKAHELEDTILAQVLGIDRMGEIYLLTAAGTNGKGETVTQTVEGASLTEVFENMPSSSDRWISLTNVTSFLIGDGVVPQDVLTFILNESGMSWRATVWYAPIAAAMIEEQADGGVARLNVLEQSGMKMVTVLDALVGLDLEGKIELPALMVSNGKLNVAGMILYEVNTMV